MSWLIWRQHRIQAMIAAALLAVFAVPVLVTGRHLNAALAACRVHDACGGNLLNGYNGVNTLVDLTIVVPAVIGLFWGAVLVGRELENGTVALVWTQTITKRRWLRVKLLTLFAGAAAFGAAVSGLVTWWSSTRNATLESRFGGLQFDIQGIVPIAFSVFAAALGLLAGALWRRALPAMATTIGGFVGVRLLVELYARPHYMSPVTKLSGMAVRDGGPLGSWMVSTDLTLNGRIITGPVNVPQSCVATTSRAAMDSCMQGLGYRTRTTYQPAGRYWTFQFIEAGIFVGLAVLLVAVAVIVLRRHDA
jgi:hypothetical protein